MSAYDEIVAKIGKDDFPVFRKNLVSSRGSLISGSMPEFMGLSPRARNSRFYSEDPDEEKLEGLGALFIKKRTSSTRDFGFIFDKDGTEAIIRGLLDGAQIVLKDLDKNLAFENDAKTQLWKDASDSLRRRLIARDMEQLKRRTDIQYRIHGSRLHYLVLGKVSAEVHDRRHYLSERLVFPLALFECVEMDCKRTTVEIEQNGFLNFSLDEKYFDSEIEKVAGEIRLDANDQLVSKLNKIKNRLEKIEFPSLEKVEVDVGFSMIGVVTGFETEYLDKAWEKILK